MTANLTESDRPAPQAAIRVLKFGGTSMGSGERILESARLVLAAGGSPVVVVSAMSGVTNQLEALRIGQDTPIAQIEERHLEAARTILSEGPGREGLERAIRARLRAVREGLGIEEEAAVEEGPAADGVSDDVRSAGEDLSVLLMTAALSRFGHRARVVDARTIVRTDDRVGGAVPDDDATVERARHRLLPLIDDGVTPVIQGFVGASADGRTTTLGRGGSDFTAAIIGAALGAPEVTIWTDVDGIYSADPGQIPAARILPELGYEEAVELAYFGARVIHPAAAKHAVGRQVALRIRNSFHPERPGTLIRIDRRGTPGVAALAFKPRVGLLTVRSRPMFMAYGFLARVFEVLTRNRVPVDLVATSHTSTSLTVDRDAPLDRVLTELDAFAEVELLTGMATVSAIGAGLLRTPGVTGEVFRALDDLPVHLISQATDTSLSFVVGEERAPEVIRRLHAALIESRLPNASPHHDP
ncbi:MAG: aspartate kinase [Gemmatimonadales bacterium]|nr:MAG: aspartate kinase [Gemmatimonadales bacterium]